MSNVLRSIGMLAGLMLFVWVLISAVPVQMGQGPIIKRMSNYRGDHFPGFAEFRVQDMEYGDLGEVILKGEPYDLLLNVTYITSAYRFEDAKKTDYSTMVFTNYLEEPILIRQPYKDVASSIRKGMEAMVK